MKRFPLHPVITSSAPNNPSLPRPWDCSWLDFEANCILRRRVAPDFDRFQCQGGRPAVNRMMNRAAAIAVSLLAVCAPLGWESAAGAVSGSPSFSTVPATDQPFSATNLDYTIPCASSPTTTITTAGTGPFSIGAATFSLQGTRYYLRCTPTGFPQTSATVTGSPQEPFAYLTNLNNYVVMFNTKGVPVWWYNDPAGPIDAKFLNASTLAGTTTPVRTRSAISPGR